MLIPADCPKLTPMNNDKVTDWIDYTAEGDYAVMEHKTDPLRAQVMHMRTGATRKFSGETCLHDAMRWAMDEWLKVAYR